MGPAVLPGGPRTPGSAPRRPLGASKEAAAICRTPPRGSGGPDGPGGSASCGGGGAWTSRYARPAPARGACAGSDAARGCSCSACGAGARAVRLSSPDPDSGASPGPDSGATVAESAPVVDDGAAGVDDGTSGAEAAVRAGARLRGARTGAAPLAVDAPPATARTVRSSVASRHRIRAAGPGRRAGCTFPPGAPGSGITTAGRNARGASPGGAAQRRGSVRRRVARWSTRRRGGERRRGAGRHGRRRLCAGHGRAPGRQPRRGRPPRTGNGSCRGPGRAPGRPAGRRGAGADRGGPGAPRAYTPPRTPRHRFRHEAARGRPPVARGSEGAAQGPRSAARIPRAAALATHRAGRDPPEPPDVLRRGVRRAGPRPPGGRCGPAALRRAPNASSLTPGPPLRLSTPRQPADSEA